MKVALHANRQTLSLFHQRLSAAMDSTNPGFHREENQVPTIKRSARGLALLGMVFIFEAGCATKKFVRQNIDPVSGRVDELQEVTQKNEAAIKDVDTRAQSGIQAAQASTNEVEQKAAAANQKAENATQLAQNTQSQISQVESAFSQTISALDTYRPVETASVQFKFDQAELTDEAIAKLDELAAKVKDSKGYVLEIRGFTDTSGADRHNLALSNRRSEAVVRYLAEQHQVPLSRMFILGFGEARDPEANRTREGRAANRRVDVVVLKRGSDETADGASGRFTESPEPAAKNPPASSKTPRTTELDERGARRPPNPTPEPGQVPPPQPEQQPPGS
jgi:OmpA-OmpF porin, OOP family